MPKLLALLALSACSPEAAPPAPGNAAEVRSQQSASAAAKVETKAAPASGEAAPKIASAPAGQRRCGWLSNPSPANWWLTDRDGQWILATQGADQAPGMDEMPDMSTAGWVETNGHYGYGCACMTITADAEGKVARIVDAEPKPLRQCRADRKLPNPE